MPLPYSDILQLSVNHFTVLNLRFVIVILLYFVDHPNSYHLDFTEARRLSTMSKAKERDNKVLSLGNLSKLSGVQSGA